MGRFDMGRTRDLIWPDLLGIGAGVGGHYLARGIDHARDWNTPFKRLQDYAALGMLGGSWAMYCADMAPNFAESWFASDLTLVMEGVADKVFGPPEESFAGLRTRKRADTTRNQPPLPNLGQGGSPKQSQLPAGRGQPVNPIIVDEELLV